MITHMHTLVFVFLLHASFIQVTLALYSFAPARNQVEKHPEIHNSVTISRSEAHTACYATSLTCSTRKQK